MDQERDELLYSNIKGKNPFKDKRVRTAFYQAIDTEAIKKKVMRGLSEPSAMMVAPGVHGGGNPKFKRLEYEPAASKKLLAEAGYPDGFKATIKLPAIYSYSRRAGEVIADILADAVGELNLSEAKIEASQFNFLIEASAAVAVAKVDFTSLEVQLDPDSIGIGEYGDLQVNALDAALAAGE